MRKSEKVHHNHQDAMLFCNNCKIWMLPFSATFAFWPPKRLVTWYFPHGCQYCKYLEIYFSFLCKICYVGLEDKTHLTQYSFRNSLQVEGHLSLWWVLSYGGWYQPQLKVCPEQLKLLCAVWPQSHCSSAALASRGRSELCMVRYMYM